MNYAAPLELTGGHVRDEWLDHNDHMNVAFYVLAFDLATGDLFHSVGLTPAYRAETGCSTFALELHVNYLRELKRGEPFRIRTQLLDHDARRLHFFHTMVHAEHGFEAATTEQISLHVDRAGPRATPMPAAIVARLESLSAAHAGLARPANAGRVIGIRRRAGG